MTKIDQKQAQGEMTMNKKFRVIGDIASATFELPESARELSSAEIMNESIPAPGEFASSESIRNTFGKVFGSQKKREKKNPELPKTEFLVAFKSFARKEHCDLVLSIAKSEGVEVFVV